MKEMINEYKEMLNRLYALGLDILGQADEEDLDEETICLVDEIENMNMHLECAKNILNQREAEAPASTPKYYITWQRVLSSRKCGKSCTKIFPNFCAFCLLQSGTECGIV